MEQVVSHYRIIRKIGTGGMGEIYLAEDTTLQRQVALKMLTSEAGAHPDRLHRFLQEAHAASALNHPNIAVIYEVGETNGKAPFIAMEYVAGEGLDEKVSKGPLPIDEIVDLGMEIADAHAKGIIHRDLKPANVMVTAPSRQDPRLRPGQSNPVFGRTVGPLNAQKGRDHYLRNFIVFAGGGVTRRQNHRENRQSRRSGRRLSMERAT